jgi:DNA-directed RNA polymerase specialized sigma24 family protein
VNDSTTPSSLACEHDFANAFLERYDPYIQILVGKKVQCASAWVGDLDADELMQRVRIKLWQALQRGTINNPGAYIQRVVDTVTIDAMRGYRLVLPLTRDEDGELYQGNLLILPGKGMQDPAEELEQKEEELEALQRLIAAVLTLPPCQQYATICTLKDRFDDLCALVNAFKDPGIDIEKVHWPIERRDIQRLRASLSFSKRKLRLLLTDSAWEDAS